MWLRRIWTRIRDTVVKKFGVWVDKECPLIEDEDDSVGEKTIKEVVDKSLLEESIISSLEKAKKERVVKVKKRQGRTLGSQTCHHCGCLPIPHKPVVHET